MFYYNGTYEDLWDTAEYRRRWFGLDYALSHLFPHSQLCMPHYFIGYVQLWSRGWSTVVSSRFCMFTRFSFGTLVIIQLVICVILVAVWLWSWSHIQIEIFSIYFSSKGIILEISYCRLDAIFFYNTSFVPWWHSNKRSATIKLFSVHSFLYIISDIISITTYYRVDLIPPRSFCLVLSPSAFLLHPCLLHIAHPPNGVLHRGAVHRVHLHLNHLLPQGQRKTRPLRPPLPLLLHNPR